MPLTGTGDALGNLIKGNIDALTDAQKQDRVQVFHAMGQAVIAHIIANGTSAVIITAQPVVVASVSAVTPGGGVSGPGAGTLTGVGNLA